MKVRKKYTMFVNPMLGTATYGTGKFSRRIAAATLGTVLDCTLSELKRNIRALKRDGYIIGPSRR